jgi:hypothetical protein
MNQYAYGGRVNFEKGGDPKDKPISSYQSYDRWRGPSRLAARILAEEMY